MEIREWKGGGIPFGYVYDEATKSLDVSATENFVLQKVFEYYGDGWGTKAIVNELNKKGLLSRFGELWTFQTLSYLIFPTRMRFYLGYHKDGVKGNWEPLITQEFADKILSIKPDPPKFKIATRSTYLLSNLDILYCGYCRSKIKASVTTKSDKSRTLYYLCSLKQNSGISQCNHSVLHKQEIINDIVLSDLQSVLTGKKDKIFAEYVTYSTIDIKRQIINKANNIIEEASTNFNVNSINSNIEDLSDLVETMGSLKMPVISKLDNNIESQRRVISEVIEKITIWADKIEIDYKIPIDFAFNFTKTKELIHGKKQISPD